MAFTTSEKTDKVIFANFDDSKFYCQEPFQIGICHCLKYLGNYMNHPVYASHISVIYGSI
jgi:hypothetical protein